MIETTQLSPPIGVEVRGLTAIEQLTLDEIEQLRSLFDQHHLLLFRGCVLSEREQVILSQSVRPVAEPTVSWISNVEDGFHPEGGLLFHSDFAYTPSPLPVLSLYAVEIGAGATPTCFVSVAQGARTLPEDLRRSLAGRSVVHVGDLSASTKADRDAGLDEGRHRLDDVGGESASPRDYPRFSRLAIWTHPVTGVPLLYVNEQQASHFEGWSCAESDSLMEATFRHVYDPAATYCHDWQVDDLVIWDNLALQHGRTRNPRTVRRSLRRVDDRRFLNAPAHSYSATSG